MFLNVILGLVFIEAGFISWRRWKLGQTSALPGDLANLTSGFCLLLAVRVALESVSLPLILLLVTAAGAAHVFDTIRRFR